MRGISFNTPAKTRHASVRLGVKPRRRPGHRRLAFVEGLESRTLLASDVDLLRDLNTTNGDSSPIEFVQLGGFAYFSAATNLHGRELWRTDGTDAGTTLVKDINPGTTSSGPTSLTVVGSTLYFVADNGVNGLEVWKSDGTAAGTVIVKDINPGLSNSSPASLTAFGSALYFSANDGTNGTELWKSDGTAAGTAMLKDIVSGGSSSPASLTVAGSTLYFMAFDNTNGYELWKSSGTAATTVIVKDIEPGTANSIPRNLTAVGSTLYFTATTAANGTELWKSDGTAATTVMVKDIVSGASSSNPANLTAVGSTLYFSATTAANGTELWKSNGTDAGTVLVKDIVSGTGNGIPQYLTAVGSTLYFIATTAAEGLELWKSDGTTATTVMVKDINPGAPSSVPVNLTAVGSTLYFTASTATNGREVWKSNGTAAGTVMVEDINPGTADSIGGGNFRAIGSTLYFSANDGVNGYEFWKSDGTAAGTSLVSNIYSATINANPQWLTRVGSTLFFTATTDAYGMELWKSDGTAAGTVLVKDIYPGSNSSSPYELTALGSTLYFFADNGVTGPELWKSDGTAAGTVLVKDMLPGSQGSIPQQLKVMGSTLYFSASVVQTFDNELWRSDGTTAGTFVLKDIDPGSQGSFPRTLTVIGSTFYFAAVTNANGYELWKSDGTATGTVMVKDIYTGTNNSSNPVNLTAVGSTLYFSATTAANGTELWKSDGTTAGTVIVKDIVSGAGSSNLGNFTAVGTTLFFTAGDGVSGTELWKSDGTTTGTVMVKDIFSGASGSNPANLTALGSTLYFSATDGVGGTELWKSDGTTTGTVMVKDIFSGASGSNPANLTALGSYLYFSATDGANGIELWRSDGTAAGTVMVEDLNPGTSNSSPTGLMIFGSTLYFTANGPTVGTEVWLLNESPIATSDAPTVLEDATSSIDVLANDSDPNGDPITIVSVTAPGHGTAVIFDNGTPLVPGDDVIRYSPDPNYFGPDSFTYTIRDPRGLIATATVNLTVTPVNDAPSFASGPGITVREDSPAFSANWAGPLVAGPANESDQSLSFQVTVDNGSGLFAVAPAISPTGVLTFTPAPDAFGVASITVVLKDSGGTLNGGGDSSVARVLTISILPVNDAPSFAGGPNPTVFDDSGPASFANWATSLFAGALNEADQLLGFTVVNDNNALFAAQPAIGADGTLTFTPNPIGTASASATVSVYIQDNGGTFLGGLDRSAVQTFTITVLRANTAPAANPDGYQVDEDGTLVVSAPGVLGNDTDAQGDALSATLLTSTAHGSLSFAADGSFTYTPAADFSGTDSFTYEAHDGSIGSVAATVTITVNAVNDAPTLANVPTAVSINEAEPYHFTATATDVDSPTLTFSLVDAPAGAAIDPASGDFTWTPAEDQGAGVYTFRVRVGDGSLSSEATVTLTVNEVNLPPTLGGVPSAATIDELSAYTFTANASDPDIPSQSLVFSLLPVVGAAFPAGANINAGTGVFTWSPTEAQGPGVYGFKVLVSDGDLFDEAEVTLTVVEVNSPPTLGGVPSLVIIAEGGTLTFTATFADDDLPANTPTYSLLGAPTGAAIDPATGVFTWTPTEAQGPGSYTFNVVVTDDGVPARSALREITVVVNEVNIAPTLTGVPTEVTLPELSTFNFTATATDADEPTQALGFSLVGAPDGAAIDTITGVFTWTPTEAQGPGVYTFAVRVGDGLTFTDSPITLRVTEANQPPILSAITDRSVDEEGTLDFIVAAVDFDSPSNDLTYSIASGLQPGMTLDPTTGAFSWTPTEDQDGTYTVIFQVDDGVGGTDTQTVVIAVAEVNRAPALADPGAKSFDEGTSLGFTLQATDGDRVNPGQAANTLSYAIVAGGQSGMTLDPITGEFAWTPGEAQDGTYAVTFSVSDGRGGSSQRVVSISVGEVNRAPSLDPIAAPTASEGSSIIFLASGHDPDLVGDGSGGHHANALTYSLIGAPAGATIDASTGLFSWTPEDGGTFTFNVRVTDDGNPALSAERAVTVTVDNVAPTATLSSNGEVTYGTATVVGFSGLSDPSAADTTAGFHYAFTLDASALASATYASSEATPSQSFDLDAGTYTIYARVIDKDGGFTDYSTTVTVRRATATILVTGYAGTYDGLSHGANGSATGVKGEDLGSLLHLGGSFVDAPGGTTAWTFEGNANYEVATGTATIAIARAVAVVTVGSVSTTYDGSAVTTTSTVMGIGGEDLGTATVSYSGESTPVNAGEYIATAFFGGSNNYEASTATATISIAKAASSVTVAGDAFVYDGTTHSGGSAVVTGAGVIDADAATLSYSGDRVNAGDYTVTATFAGDANHLGGFATATISIARATATIVVNGYTGTYDATPHGATGTATGVGGVDLGAGLDLGATFTNAPGGTATWTFIGGTNYTDQSGTASVVIGKADATIVVTPYSVTYDGAPHTATGAAKGVLGEELTGLVLVGSTHTVAGTYTDTWTFTDATGNYNAASGTVVDTIAKATASVVVSGYTGTYDATSHGATGTATGVGGVDMGGGLNLGASFTNAPGGTANWTFIGGPNYTDQSGTVSIAIARANATIVVTPYSVIYDGLPHTATGTARGVQGEALSGLSLAGTTHTNAGEYPTDPWTFTDATGNYNAASGTVHDRIENHVALAAGSAYILNTTMSGAVTASGNASIQLPGGLYVNSNSTSAILASGNARINVGGTVQVVGGVSKSGNANVTRTGTPASTADPLASLVSPALAGTNFGAVSVSGNTTRTLSPGIYSSIQLSGNAVVTMSPGLYIIRGGGFAVSGNASVSGAGVTIFNAGSGYTGTADSGNFGGISLSGNGRFDLSPPTSGPYDDILIYQSRLNTRAISISGNATVDVDGIIYAANAMLTMSGNGRLDDILVVNSLNISGNVILTQMAAGGGDLADAGWIASTLLAGDQSVYISNPGGFGPDMLARIRDAIGSINTLLIPYNVNITEVDDPSLASIVLDTATISASGGASDGVLGSYDPSSNPVRITLLQGWNWYTSGDPAGIDAHQYDFQTTVLHELGHALGLGHSDNTDSPMSATLATGATHRIMTVADLSIPETPDGVEPLVAAGFAGDPPRPADTWHADRWVFEVGGPTLLTLPIFATPSRDLRAVSASTSPASTMVGIAGRRPAFAMPSHLSPLGSQDVPDIAFPSDTLAGVRHRSSHLINPLEMDPQASDTASPIDRWTAAESSDLSVAMIDRALADLLDLATDVKEEPAALPALDNEPTSPRSTPDEAIEEAQDSSVTESRRIEAIGSAIAAFLVTDRALRCGSRKPKRTQGRRSLALRVRDDA